MVEGERLDCPLCDKSYANTASGRGRFKRHLRRVHLPEEPVFVRRFRYWDGEKYVEGDINRYVCPFPGCDYDFIDRMSLWRHFSRKDHFRHIIFKKKRKAWRER